MTLFTLIYFRLYDGVYCVLKKCVCISDKISPHDETKKNENKLPAESSKSVCQAIRERDDVETLKHFFSLPKSINSYLHMTVRTMESSSAEFGRRGLEPSHFNVVPSSSGSGRNVNVETTMLPFV